MLPPPGLIRRLHSPGMKPRGTSGAAHNATNSATPTTVRTTGQIRLRVDMPQDTPAPHPVAPAPTTRLGTGH